MLEWCKKAGRRSLVKYSGRWAGWVCLWGWLVLFDLRLTFSWMDSFFLDMLFSILLIDLLQLSSCSDKLVIRNYFQLPRTAINFNFWKTFIYANLSRFCDSQLLYRTFNRILIFRTTRRGATVQKRFYLILTLPLSFPFSLFSPPLITSFYV